MAGLAAANLFIPSLMSEHHHHHLFNDEEDLDLEILHDPSHFLPFHLFSHEDLDDSHRDFDSDIFVPVFPFDLTPKGSSFTTNSNDPDSDGVAILHSDLFDRFPTHQDLVLEVERHPLDMESRDFDDGDCEMGSGFLELGVGLGFDGEKESRVVEIGSGSEVEDDKDGIFGLNCDGGSGGEVDSPLHWDCLRIEDERRELNEEFEWEEVSGVVSEREDLGLEGQLDEGSIEVEIGSRGQVDPEETMEGERSRSTGWEVLLAVNNINRSQLVENEGGESYLGNPNDADDGYVYTSEYDVLVGQFADHESSVKGTPPAAQSAVESLPSVFLTQEDVVNNNVICVVCKDEMSLEERVKQLPCLHHYHGDCILPWLAVRNTCPVCRYELPTDDAEYESWKARRASAGGRAEEGQAGYLFEVFPEV